MDTLTRGIVFGIDHYRPRSLFPSEANDYKNLFYCCGQCNSRKSNHWPNPEFADVETIPNPCGQIMTKHLRFRGAKVEFHSPSGEFTCSLLDLNDPEAVKFREHAIHMVELILSKYEEWLELIEEAHRKVRQKRISLAESEAFQAECQIEISRLEDALAMYYGTVPV